MDEGKRIKMLNVRFRDIQSAEIDHSTRTYKFTIDTAYYHRYGDIAALDFDDVERYSRVGPVLLMYVSFLAAMASIIVNY